jgi:hypothetical protein
MRFSRDGLEWIYELTLPIEGIIIKGTSLENKFIIPVACLLFAFLAFILYPLRDSMRAEIMR